MKVLHINASYKPAYVYGGPTVSVSMLCEQLHGAGIDVEVYTTTANGVAELPVKPNETKYVDNVAVTYFKRVTKDHTHFSPALLGALNKKIKQFDIVHIHAWWNLVSVLSCYVAIKNKVPVVLSPRGTLSAYSFSNKNTGFKSYIHRFLGKRLLQKCLIHATSVYEASAINRLMANQSTTVIPNLIRLSDEKDQSPERFVNNKLRLLFLSRIEEKKGLDILLRSLEHITVPFSLTIAGSGDPEYIEKLKLLIPESQKDNIEWAGFYGDGKFKQLAAHDLLVLPSHDENFGNVVIESLSAGTPVLISNKVGLASYVETNNLGWICEPDIYSISNTIIRIYINEQKKLTEIRGKAPGVIHHEFSGERLVKRYIDLYQSIKRTT
ncbi:XrtY-associated glycosyltransferase XYAG1 [Mucilaginibacter litoreus]|uniref:XrtY-associated glycosyltransferase XYAG1 n=1 Tax=Mucilaginibacter litoreus TaxID=1048221 RepID=A0ABW3AVF3_9SPHI